MSRTSFGDQLQQMWRSRPVRLPRQGPIAGVAAGVGARYHVDPVLVRVAFVVSTIFGGAGIVLYLAAWLLLNEAGDQASAAGSLFGKGASSQSQTKTIVLLVALAIAVTTMGPIGVGLAGSGLISMALLLGGWWMLFMRYPQPPPGTIAPGDVDANSSLTSTGYPGAVFPPPVSPSRSAPENFYSPGFTPTDFTSQPIPPTDGYSPYTKLPERYVPDTPPTPSGTAPIPAETTTERLNTDDADTETLTAADADTVLLNKSDADTVLLDKGGDTNAADAAPASSAANHTRRTATGVRTPTSMSGPTPPAWDPLGVAPLAWDLPAPGPARTIVAPPPKRPRSRLTPMVLGLAIIAAAGAGAAAAAGVEWMTPARIGAVALAVIGLGLAFGAFFKRGYGLLVVTAPLAGFVLLASLIEFDSATMGKHTWAPTTMTDLQSEYTVTMGSGTLNLRTLELTEDRTVEVVVRMGDAHILLPAGMTVDTECDVAMGDITVAGGPCTDGRSGPDTPGAPVLDLNFDVRAGSVEVDRG